MTTNIRFRIGIDLGGTKIEGIALHDSGAVEARVRLATPQGDYAATVAAVREIVVRLEKEVGRGCSVGIGHPGSLSPGTGRIRNANSTCLNDRPLRQDLEAALARPVRMANDANCLALSEATDGAGAGGGIVFAVILGTGCGGGWVVNGEQLYGHQGLAGEWGHNPLPWMRPEWNEYPGIACWCGRHGCIEQYLSGPGMAHDHLAAGGLALDAAAIAAGAAAKDAACEATLGRYEDRLARSLAQVINMVDPDIIVLGGGVSRVQRLYRYVPALWDQWVFSDAVDTPLVAALHGDSSGVRGAAWLWPAPAARAR